ncbi:hypothetical protein ACJMK2_034232 [Sinanodonta woodiana]|uniref:RNA polymerase I-specific transcription initiation factor RRN3 n=1 Tax=Sinanodonta woodiana TaxID=1069815 RepID=A0ABD3WQX0_SINWO
MSMPAVQFDMELILENFTRGASKDYNIFLGQLSDPEINDDNLVKYLNGLRHCITSLDRTHEMLVGKVLRLDWAGRRQAVVQVYQSLLLNLVSVHTDYLKAGLRMIVAQFLPKAKDFMTEDEESTRAIQDSVRKKHDVIFINLHTLLKAIAQIIPMTPVLLLPLLSEHFPYLKKETYIQECYVKNLLQVTHYIPSIRQRVLELVVDRMIKLDVRCPRHLVEEAESQEDMEDGDIFDLEDGGSKKSLFHQSDEGYISRLGASARPMKHKEADRLDIMMDLVFSYMHNTCYTNGELDWETTKLLYREMLMIFERIILPTYASCHVQFIMFYLCSIKESICEGFIDYLWKKVQDPNTAAIFRQVAVAYMGSLLARGKFVPLSMVKTCLDLMTKWIHSYLDHSSQDTVHADITHHAPFYSVCQSLFYVFVFRNKDLIEMKRGYKWVESLNFQRIITSRLNPLRVISPLIVKTFASITRMHQLAFCDTVIDRNNRMILPISGDSSTSWAGRETKMLDTFFPFDPYLLSRSGRFIISHYQEFQGNLEEENPETSDEEEEDMFAEEAARSVENSLMLPFCNTLAEKSTVDFMNYGTSPGFKHH